MKKLASLVLVVFLVVSFTGCGTIFFAQRQKADHSGRMDPNILILDGIGLLFWIFPGVIAYGVDFATGAIYLPPNVQKGEGPFIKDAPGGESKPEPKSESKPEPQSEKQPQ
jgi:hypothetical protein